MKNFILKRFIALGVISALSFSACQKAETQAELVQANNDDAEMNLVGSAAKRNNIKGLISESAASRMAATYKQNYKGDNYTEYVVFDVEDMERYIKQIKKKYKSDKVYVYFGQYDEVTAPSPKDKGRVSVFFLGNNKLTSSGNFRSQATTDGTDTEGSNYLNHGTIHP
jgi:hypothetical protein